MQPGKHLPLTSSAGRRGVVVTSGPPLGAGLLEISQPGRRPDPWPTAARLREGTRTYLTTRLLLLGLCWPHGGPEQRF